MTHDELLKTIDSWQHSDSCALLMDDYCDCPFKALRAVMELHKPNPEGDECSHCGWECGGKLVSFPCPTIQAIEKELG